MEDPCQLYYFCVTLTFHSKFQTKAQDKLRCLLYNGCMCAHPHFLFILCVYLCVYIFTCIYNIFLCILCAFLICPIALRNRYCCMANIWVHVFDYSVFVAVLGALHELTNFILTITLCNRYLRKLRCRVSYTQGHTATAWWNQGSNPGSLASQLVLETTLLGCLPPLSYPINEGRSYQAVKCDPDLE